MNKLDQEIIEIIEPCMNKTLTFWCIIKSDKIKERNHLFDYGIITNIIYGKNNFEFECHEVRFENNVDEFKILGHYDITAVLKYIEKNVENIGGEITETSIGEDIYFYIAIGYSNTENGEELMDEMEITIPNKPLHLYTEEEKQTLLTILKQLGV